MSDRFPARTFALIVGRDPAVGVRRPPSAFFGAWMERMYLAKSSFRGTPRGPSIGVKISWVQRFFEREEEAFVALCPELDIASEGRTIEEARANLVEAVSLFFETADPSEVVQRFHDEIVITQIEVPVG